MSQVPSTSAATTDVGEFISDLDGGQFDRMLSAALSQVAASVIDNEKTGEVSVKFAFERIPGTHQVLCKHTCKFTRPTMDGKAGEEVTRKTALHVGKFGVLSLEPPNQMAFLDRKGEPTVG